MSGLCTDLYEIRMAVSYLRRDPVAAAHRRFERDLQWLPETARLLTDPTPVDVSWSPKLQRLTNNLKWTLATRYGLEDTLNR